METFVAVTLAAAVVTKLVDTTRNGLDKRGTAPKVVWNLLALGLGVLGAFLFRIEPVQVPDAFRFQVSGAALQLATGLSVGAYSSGLHEFFHFLSGKARRP
jgi:hypothetical protein